MTHSKLAQYPQGTIYFSLKREGGVVLEKQEWPGSPTSQRVSVSTVATGTCVCPTAEMPKKRSGRLPAKPAPEKVETKWKKKVRTKRKREIKRI